MNETSTFELSKVIYSRLPGEDKKEGAFLLPLPCEESKVGECEPRPTMRIQEMYPFLVDSQTSVSNSRIEQRDVREREESNKDCDTSQNHRIP